MTAKSTGCGCAPIGVQTDAPVSCDLGTFCRPEFAEGQLLTDEDLDALVGWARGKRQLQRHVEGWGVACGLGLSLDPSRPSVVRVAPGLALDPCGRDLVVPDAAEVDVRKACKPREDPCARFDPNAPQPAPPADEEEVCDPCGGEDLVPFEVVLHYDEEPGEPHRTFGSGCAPPSCVPLRVCEGYALELRPCRDPGWPDYWHWYCCYLRTCIEPFRKIAGQRKWKDARDGLVRLLQRRPPTTFSRLVECLCELDGEDGLAELFLMAMVDHRLAFFRQPCAEASADDGVPLGCVWTRPTADGCAAVLLDAFPPSRRVLAKEGPPAPFGWTNLSPFVGMRPLDLCRMLRSLGLRGKVTPVPFEIGGHADVFAPFDPRDLAAACRPSDTGETLDYAALVAHSGEQLAAHCEMDLFAYTVDCGVLGCRVVAFGYDGVSRRRGKGPWEPAVWCPTEGPGKS